jgi:sterol 3beta-glucosyltransferase
MHITVLAIGTRGDVQPLVALGVGLQQTGRHQVCLVAPGDFEPLAQSAGLGFFSLGMNVRELLRTRAFKSFVEPGGNLILGMGEMLRMLRPMLNRMMENAWSASREAEAAIFSTLGLGAYHIADKLGVPCYWALPFPGFARTRAFPSLAFPSLRLGGAYNLLTHVLAERLIQQLTGRFLNQWRRERFNLPPLSPFKWPYNQLHGQPVPRLYSFSPILFPKPPDWGEDCHITGYWFLDHPPGWQPPAGLVDFLESGSPPVYVGFGSLPHRDPRQTIQIVLEALGQSGQRGVIATGWGGLDSGDLSHLPDDVFTLESVPHDWLFPRMAAVVHHGGSGTTGAGLRAGVPSVIVPHAGDQLLWARRVTELGVGPRPVPRQQLIAEQLAAAITRAVTDKDVRTRAAALGERIRAEDGVARAIGVIERPPREGAVTRDTDRQD